MTATPELHPSSNASSDHGPRADGVVKWFSPAKGYGFIETADDAPAGSERDVFVHHSALTNDDRLYPGDRVSFRLHRGPKGPSAEHVERI